MCTHHPKWQQKLSPPHLIFDVEWRNEIWKDLCFVQSGSVQKFCLAGRHPGGGLALAPSVHPSLYLGLTWADGLTPPPCASNVRFPNAVVRRGLQILASQWEACIIALGQWGEGFWSEHFTNCSFRKIPNELFQSLQNSALQCPHNFITPYVYITAEPRLKSQALLDSY